MSEIENKRFFSYDVLRIIAVIAVVMIHVSSGYISEYAKDSFEFFCGNFFDGISRLGVPLFVMLSGALILNEKKDFSLNVMPKYVARLFILLCVWSFLYAVVFLIIKPYFMNEGISISEFVRSFIYGYYHLWYLYMMIGLYLITPILKKFVNRENKEVLEWFLVLSVIFQFTIPLIDFFVGEHLGLMGDVQAYGDSFRVGFVSKFTSYYLLGWYISNIEIAKKTRRCIYILGSVSLTFTIIATQIYISDDKTSGLFYNNLELNILLYSLAIFVFVFYKLKDVKVNKVINRIVESLSKMTFGVYIIHVAILTVVRKVVDIQNALIDIIVIWFITLILSFLGTYIMSKIPYVKKLVKY